MRPVTLGLLFSVLLLAQPWAGILDTSRAMDWSIAGAGTIPARATICQTLTSSATAANINTAISNCTAGQTVLLSAGTYTIGSPGITFGSKSNVTLRGEGADQTILNFTSAGHGSCNGLGSAVCAVSDGGWSADAPGTTANWTAGYAKGTTDITLSATTNLNVGDTLILDQLDDTSDDGTIYNCQTIGTCTSQGADVGRAGRGQHQIVVVTAINGSVVSITPPLINPNWRSARTPQAWWSSSSAPVTGIGIENLTFNFTSVGTNTTYGIQFHNVTYSWIKGIRSIGGNNAHINLYQDVFITVRDSYFDTNQGACSQAYGIEPWMSDAHLVENNIWRHIASPMVMSGSVGSVLAYNYAQDDYFNCGDPAWFQAAQYHHEQGSNYILWEGNNTPGMTADNIHGPSVFGTAFRNRIDGKDPLNTNTKSEQTVPINIYSFNRLFNFVGNILGYSGFHTTYEVYTTTSGAQSGSNCDVTIYRLGWGGNCDNTDNDGDPTLRSTIMRWGNWDVVTSTNDNGTNDSTGIKWEAGEVPTGLSSYSNAVPGNQTLPASFYLSSRPSAWWKVGATTPAWPPIGPDVANGDISNTGGHANKIPAQLCFESLADDPAFAAGTVQSFNASTCYTSASDDTTRRLMGGNGGRSTARIQ